jgi:toxin ParE1/3/4
MKYSISIEAAADLENIWLYTMDYWSQEQADNYYHLLLNTIEFLAEHPESGKDVGYIRQGYFRKRVKSHFIFYRINRSLDVLEVIRILHQSMDVENRLGR